MTVYKILNGYLARDCQEVPPHRLHNGVVGQKRLHHVLLQLTLCSAFKEPADESRPHPANQTSAQRLPNTSENKKESDEASGKGGDGRRAPVLAGDPPHDG